MAWYVHLSEIGFKEASELTPATLPLGTSVRQPSGQGAARIPATAHLYETITVL
jgi:hypothetical protein